MIRWIIFALLVSCVSDPVSEKQVASSSNSEVVDDTSQYFYEAYRMVGHNGDRHVAIQLEVLQNIPQKIYLVDLASSEPWTKISEVVEVSLDCPETTNCRGEVDGQEFMMSWAKKEQVVGQLFIYHDRDDGTRTAHAYNRVLTAMGEQLDLDSEVIQQRYFTESVVDSDGITDGFDFLVGRQENRFQVEVDRVFTISFKMKDPASKVARTPESPRVEAHDKDGNIVEDVLARGDAFKVDGWTIFSPLSSSELVPSELTTNYSVFFVPEALKRGVTKLVGYADGVKAGEVNVELLPSGRTLMVDSSGSKTTYNFIPTPDTNHRKGVYRFLHIQFAELDGNGVVTGNKFDTGQGHLSAGSTNHSDSDADSYQAGIKDFPCVAPNTIYAWLKRNPDNDREIRLNDRKLYRIDCP